jgi:hypothetical protein
MHKKHMNPISNIDDAKKAIEAHEGNAEDFELPIAEELQDPVGINMAIITDNILARGWEPNGFVQNDGYRIYLYKRMQ